MVFSLFYVPGHVLENCLGEFVVGMWCTSEDMLSEACCLSSSNNVFLAESNNMEELPTELLNQLTSQFSFPNNWVLDLTNSKGIFDMINKWVFV